jgi:hypothetical protein
MFYELMKSTIEDGADFMDGEWARLHYDVLERHHLSRHCPSDVTLFDVLEMLFDCVSAGMTRSGSVYPIEISNEILQKAVSNTVDYLVKHIEVADRKTENSSEKPNNCEYAENPSGDVWECGCFLDTYCEHQIYDRNPDGTINIVECGYEPKDEPTISKMEQVDEPSGYCNECKWYGDKQVCGRCRSRNLYAPKTEPQWDVDKGTTRCDNCSENGSYKCSKCDGEMYFKRLAIEDVPQTERSRR